MGVRCPSDKKEGREIDSFKGNLSKKCEISKIFRQIDSFLGVLDPEMSKFYATLGSCFPFTSNIRDGFYFLLILA